MLWCNCAAHCLTSIGQHKAGVLHTVYSETCSTTEYRYLQIDSGTKT